MIAILLCISNITWITHTRHLLWQLELSCWRIFFFHWSSLSVRLRVLDTFLKSRDLKGCWTALFEVHCYSSEVCLQSIVKLNLAASSWSWGKVRCSNWAPGATLHKLQHWNDELARLLLICSDPHMQEFHVHHFMRWWPSFPSLVGHCKRDILPSWLLFCQIC